MRAESWALLCNCTYFDGAHIFIIRQYGSNSSLAILCWHYNSRHNRCWQSKCQRMPPSTNHTTSGYPWGTRKQHSCPQMSSAQHEPHGTLNLTRSILLYCILMYHNTPWIHHRFLYCLTFCFVDSLKAQAIKCQTSKTNNKPNPHCAS